MGGQSASGTARPFFKERCFQRCQVNVGGVGVGLRSGFSLMGVFMVGRVFQKVKFGGIPGRGPTHPPSAWSCASLLAFLRTGNFTPSDVFCQTPDSHCGRSSPNPPPVPCRPCCGMCRLPPFPGLNWKLPPMLARRGGQPPPLVFFGLPRSIFLR